MIYYRYWGNEEMNTMPPKGEGKTVMTSDFISIHGLLRSGKKYLLKHSKWSV
jgi:hypothetical protein